MLLFLKCHKVSLEVILENQEKNSSGCFAWSWKVSVPKKSVRKNEREKRGRWREGKLQSDCFGACSANSLRASTVCGYPKKLRSGLLAECIFMCVDASRKQFAATVQAALPREPGGPPEQRGAAVLHCIVSS